jgi:hypothetical protein
MNLALSSCLMSSNRISCCRFYLHWFACTCSIKIGLLVVFLALQTAMSHLIDQSVCKQNYPTICHPSTSYSCIHIIHSLSLKVVVPPNLLPSSYSMQIQ